MQYGFDYVRDDAITGFRLERLEVLNWGTFHEKVWSLQLDSRNGLLTGDIGTGKSTLVDALTTLLVPPSRAAYNKAAGAGSRERSPKSYALGYYKTERGDFSDGTARPVALRDGDGISVILGAFRNAGYVRSVTLAVVFWDAARAGQPRRFYVAWDGDDSERSIAASFSGFGGNPRDLRKRLRRSGAQIWNTYPEYGAWFRRRLWIHDQQALELFHQTVSMKSIGNLTGFVRRHMLERFDADPVIDQLIGHFDDLDRAHKAVLKAKRQIRMLKPIQTSANRHEKLVSEIEALRSCEAAHPSYFAGLKHELVTERLRTVNDGIARLQAKLNQLDEELRTQRQAIDRLHMEIQAGGGSSLDQLDKEIDAKEREACRRRSRADSFARLLERLAESVPQDAESFAAQRQRLLSIKKEAPVEEQRLRDQFLQLQAPLGEATAQCQRLEVEVESLRSRRSNIPAADLRRRTRLCEALGLAEAEAPFAGELIAVREEASEWEGAAERLLRNFGLSLLVPDSGYSEVAGWVDRTGLGGRLSYLRVVPARRRPRRAGRDSLSSKLSVKQDSPHFHWLREELTRRFDHVCCRELETFRQERKAITRSGQVKRGKHHVKDDRHSISDRKRYILGWTNRAKIAALEASLAENRAAAAGLQARCNELEELLRQQRDRTAAVDGLLAIERYEDVDWRSPAREIERLKDSRAELERELDKLKPLRNELDRREKERQSIKHSFNLANQSIGAAQLQRSELRRQHGETQSALDAADLEADQAAYPRLAKLMEQVLGGKRLTLERVDRRAAQVSNRIRQRSDDLRRKATKVRRDLEKRMAHFNQEYPVDSADMDANAESVAEYREKLALLESDGLPEFESRFKRLLNENTIREVVSFHNQLEKERRSINERIRKINETLTGIEYNPGRYIQIEDQLAPDREIREFRKELKACLSGALSGSGDGPYSEGKFRQVKQIIERLRGDEGYADLGRRWRSKVTDVRNWFVFSVSERKTEDDSEYEHYSDSAGRSGGQKEKLAYTILGAALVYQFGLESGSNRSQAFRFIVIDEAFGRGSDESARHALELFSRLHLQVLIVTPLQKIHVIEPYVRNVGFIEIEGGRVSKLRNLTIDEYRQKKRHAQESPRATAGTIVPDEGVAEGSPAADIGSGA